MPRPAEENPEACRFWMQTTELLREVQALRQDKHTLLRAVTEQRQEIVELRTDFEETNTQLIAALDARDQRIEELCHVQP